MREAIYVGRNGYTYIHTYGSNKCGGVRIGEEEVAHLTQLMMVVTLGRFPLIVLGRASCRPACTSIENIDTQAQTQTRYYYFL